MLIYLQIRDFAIVDQLELEFEPGMLTITGETGAGKSIMIDALGLLLGDRAESSIVRPGAERAEISAVFDIGTSPQARNWLSEHNLAIDDVSPGEAIDKNQDTFLEQDKLVNNECHLRRLIAANGRSRAYINGSIQPLQVLRELGELLVDIHSQHEHQSLLQRNLQRQLLDAYGRHHALLTQLTKAFQHWQDLRRQLDQIEQSDAERDARLDLLRFQVRELDLLAPRAQEPAELETEQRRLANATRLLESSQRSLDQLYDDDQAVHSILSRLLTDISILNELDDRLAPIQELLGNALIQIEEAGNELRDYLQTISVDLDPERRAWVEQRLADIHSLSRKHRIKAEQLPEQLTRLRSELDLLENSEARREDLQQQIQQALKSYNKIARKLSEKRHTTAASLNRKVSQSMRGLGMPGGRFAVTFTPLDRPSLNGAESIEFIVSANPGQPMKPLNKVASGGELSRISLAIQVIAADSTAIPTLVFDEVDSGIGGAVAEVVGQQLRCLAARRQVLCVTHLAQVAAQAHHHLRVDKKTHAGITYTDVIPLDAAARAKEIARMLGGVKLTDHTLAHAREMITQAQRG